MADICKKMSNCMEGIGNAMKHKVFISYHREEDSGYKRIFELVIGQRFEILNSDGLSKGEIYPKLPNETIRQKIRDEYLRDSSVTVVLIGQETWRQKDIDWEISASIRSTELSPGSGLLGLVLPSYYEKYGSRINPRTIPPRLWINVKCGFAVLQNWSNHPEDVQEWLNEAYLNLGRIGPDDSDPLFVKNRGGEEWNRLPRVLPFV